jgi:hypothetical protein
MENLSPRFVFYKRIVTTTVSQISCLLQRILFR